MSVGLLTTDELAFTALTGLDGAGELTVACTIKVASSVAGADFVSKWNASTNRNFKVYLSGATIRLAVQPDSNNIYIEGAASTTLTANTLYRIVARWWGTPNMDFWINGVQDAGTLVLNQGSGVALKSVTGTAYIGRNSEDSKNAVDGDYSEIAIWNTKLPDSVAKAISFGASPDIHRRGGLFYLRATSVDRLVDEWGRTPITNSGGTTKAHPAVKDAPFVWNTPGLWGRRTYFFPTVATGGGLSIPVAMASYRQRRVA